MKVTICVLFALALCGVVFTLPALPVELPQGAELAVGEPLQLTGEEEHGLRLKRATCDIGSFQSQWFTPNHSLCALHCVFLGKKGGYCKDTICYCRN